jgi:hypothetical protein
MSVIIEWFGEQIYKNSEIDPDWVKIMAMFWDILSEILLNMLCMHCLPVCGVFEYNTFTLFSFYT